MESLYKENLNKTLIIKLLSENFCQNINCSHNKYDKENDRNIDFKVSPEQNNFISPKKIANSIHYQNSSYDKRIYSESRYKFLQSSQSNTQLIDSTIEGIVHQNLKTGSRDNFKENRRPAVVTNNFS